MDVGENTVPNYSLLSRYVAGYLLCFEFLFFELERDVQRSALRRIVQKTSLLGFS